MGFSSYPPVPGIAGSKNDFVFFFIGPIEVGQWKLIPPHEKRQAVDVDQLKVALQVAPLGRDAIFGFYKNGVLIDIVTVPAGQDKATTNLTSAVHFEAEDRATMRILQTGLGVRGETATGYMRIANAA